MLSLHRQRRRNVRAQVRYLWTLLKRFKTTFLLLAVVQLGGAAIIWFGYRDTHPVSFPKALAAVYFLMMGQPSLELPDSWMLMLVTVVIPPLGLAVVADGLVRFAYLFFSKHRNDREWITVQTQAMKGHVVLAGAGRVGVRILDQLIKLGVDVVVVEKNEQAAFVETIRQLGVPLLISDMKTDHALESCNIQSARALVCATDDDLANLNIALDARRLNPFIHVVMRFFDDDLVKKVKDAFKVEALSTSALAAPAFAASAVDPTILNSFDVAGQTMVVGQFQVDGALAGKTVADLRDKQGGIVLRLARENGPFQDAASADALRAGDRVIVQARLEDYRRLRGEAAARP